MMKKSVLLIVAMAILSLAGLGQISGTKSIPGDYPSLAAAIAALNSSGVGIGGVTFNVAADYTETFSALNSGLITTSTSDVTKPIVFQKSGSGANPLITGFSTAPSTSDYVICIAGTDYITFDGIDVTEPTGVIEWGYAILKESVGNGSQYVAIKNCNITLNKTNVNTIGIYSNNVTPGAPGSQLTIISDAGTNSNNKYYNNTISNVYSGILLAGYNDVTAPYSFYDHNNGIGKDGGNTITNFGGGTTAKYGIYTYYQNNLKISNNNINGTVDGNGQCAGIELFNANNANADINNNTISIQFTGTTASFYGIYNNMGTTFSNNTLNFYGNTVTGCTFPNATSGTCYYLYNTCSAANMYYYGNIITNNTYGSATATATGTVYYMYNFGTPSTLANIFNVYNNTVTGNSRLQSVTGSGSTYYIYLSGGGPLTEINAHHNLIDNNSAPTTGTTAGIYFLTGSGNTTKNAYANTITNISNVKGTFYGLYTGNGLTNNFYNNRVQGISSAGTTGTLYGIYLSSGTGNGTMNVYNNIIAELYGPTMTSGTAIYGIYLSGTQVTYARLYHNTIYLNGTSTGASFGAVGMYAGTSPSSVDIANNIIINNITPGATGLAVALKWGSPSYLNFASTSNNNNYFAGTPGPAHLIFYDGTNMDQTLEDYKSRFWPKEGQSVTELTPFVNITSSPYDLHVNPAIPTQCESSAIPINQVDVSFDYDNNSRFPNSGYPVNPSYPPTASDIGADEFGGIPNNIVGPTIAYTPFMNTASFNARTLTATITDVHGVPVTGIGLPRIAWKVNQGGTWTYTTGVSIGNNQFTFTFGSGVTLGDTVHYYVVAQDNFPTPAVGTYPFIGASGYSTNPPASNPPNIPSKYKIVQGICGTISVGTGHTYTTLSDALSYLSDKEITCPVTLLLTDNSYNSENYPIIINPIAGASATNTLTIKPAPGTTPVFQTSYLGVMPNPWSQISINGAQWIIFDGSNTPGGTDRSMTFRNTASNGFAAAIGLYNNGNIGASNIVVKNCNLQAHQDQVYNAQGFVCYNIDGLAGYQNIVLDNNFISSAKYGVQITGIAAYPVQNAQVTNNTIGSLTAGNGVAQYPIFITYANNVLVEGNEIIGIPDGLTYGGSPFGINISSGSNDIKVRKNIIHDVVQNGTAFPSGGAFGIYVFDDATAPVEISNNVIYNIKAPGQNFNVTGANPNGIFISSGNNIKIFHNSVYMGGNYMSATTAGMSSCIGIGNNITGIQVVDNILKNSSQPVSGTPASKTFCITAGSNTSFGVINYNDYFADGIGPKTGYFGGSDRATLADWQAATGQDGNSISVDPQFTSSTYLLPTTTLMNNAGTYLTLVPTDIVDTLRSNPPDMGAYEYATDPFVLTTGSGSVGINTATVYGSINAKSLTVNGFFEYGPTTAYGFTIISTPPVITGSTSTPINAGLSGLQPLTTYHFRAKGVVDPSGLIGYGQDMTFTTLPNPPAVITTAATAITTTGGTLNGTVNANGGNAIVTFEWGLTTGYGNTVSATPSAVGGTSVTPVSVPITGLDVYTTYHFRAVATNEGGTTYGNDMTFTTLGLPASVITTPATMVGATTATLNGTVDANYTPTTTSFEWGETTSYGNTITGVPATVTGHVITPVSATINSLTQGSTYHFRCVGSNATGTIYGQDQVFITDCPAPAAPGAITGQVNICVNTHGLVYTIDEVSGALGYYWTVPDGATIVAGSNTTSITVDYSLSAQSGNITVAALNSCGAGPASSLAVTLHPLPVPVINGPVVTCYNSNYNYSTETGMTNYIWSVNGGTITSGNGTSSINVTWNSTGNKTVSVSYTNSNGCSSLNPTVLNVIVSTLPTPTIIGNNITCINSSYDVYTTEEGKSGYQWSLTGGTIVTGQGTYQVEVDWTSAGMQTISVNWANESGCFAANPTVLSVEVKPMPGPAGIITGADEVCAGEQGVPYSINAIPNVLNYVWTVPQGAVIVSGSNTNSIRVDFAPDAISGNITVYGENICGSGPSASIFVNINPIPPTPVITADENYLLTSSAPEGNQWYLNGEPIPGATGQTYQAEEEGTYYVIVTLNGCSSAMSNQIEIVFTGIPELESMKVSVFPNPSNGGFWLVVNGETFTRFDVKIYSPIGVCEYQLPNVESTGTFKQYIDLQQLPAGMYTLVIQSGSGRIIRKLFIE